MIRCAAVLVCLLLAGCFRYQVGDVQTGTCHLDLMIELCKQKISPTTTIVSMPGILPALIGGGNALGAAALTRP